ncbi:alcohol dehydrogenase class IV [Sinorhizobium medicae]
MFPSSLGSGLPGTLRDLGLEEERIDWVAEQSSGITRLIQNNPRPLNPKEMRNLVAAAYRGDRSCLN